MPAKSRRSITEAEGVSKLLIQASFGPSTASIQQALSSAGKQESAPLAEGDIDAAAKWVEDQMGVPETSLRAHYRRRTNSASDGQPFAGRMTDVCEIDSRWNRYAFDGLDIGHDIEFVNKPAIKGWSVVLAGVVRTEVKFDIDNNPWDASTAAEVSKVKIQICKLERSVGGRMEYAVAPLTCATNWRNYVRTFANPAVEFASKIAATTQVFSASHVTMTPINAMQTGDDESDPRASGSFALSTLKNAAGCNDAISVAGKSFIGVDQGNGNVVYYGSDRRMRLIKNTLTSPAEAPTETDGGGACPSVARNFLNAASCVRRLTGACVAPIYVSTILKLSPYNLRQWYTLSDKHVHVVTGLRLKESPTEKNIKPCDSKKVTRWIRIAESGGCATPTTFDSGTATTIGNAIKASGTGANRDTNPNIRDIDISAYAALNAGSTCNSGNANLHVGARVEVDGTSCWQHSHSQEQNVYDFTAWVNIHPGTKTANENKRPNPITQFSMRGESVLEFPSWHEMSRWESKAGPALQISHTYLAYAGRNGDNVDFATLPSTLQTQEMADSVGANSETEPIGFEACGSRNEVENDPSLGNRYTIQQNSAAVRDDFDQYFKDGDQSATIWNSVVLAADDQLRQRMAWALSQIVVTGQPGFGLDDYVEVWANYYDIFVHHAFGNYRDILREVAASPLMGEYLTFVGNKAYARHQKYPDENFSREMMQLFSIGLFELNMDGTRKVHAATGDYVPTYTNEDIMDQARVWTGWTYQDARGNIESRTDSADSANKIDPMMLEGKWRDRFPKMTLDKNYLGDVYPLCSDLPNQSFLRKGSKFQFHGPVSSYGELHDIYEKDPTTTKTHFTPNRQTSGLYAALCGPKIGGKCSFPPLVTLEDDLTCDGEVECNTETLRSIKLVDGDAAVYYMYVEPPCVHLAFFDDGRALDNHNARQCADPTDVGIAGFACCRTTDTLNAFCPEGYKYVDISWSTTRGDYCMRSGGWQWVCPEGCEETADRSQPRCTDTATGSTCSFSSAISDGGDACHYIAEPLSYDAARERCAAVVDGGDLCFNHRDPKATDDFQSANWKATCAGYQYAWTTQACSLQVQIYPSGRVSIVENLAKTSLKENSGNEFRVAWAEDGGLQNSGEPSAFPTFSGNCSAGCIPMPEFGGSCLCDVTVEDQPEFADASATLPTAAELRATLHIGAHSPQSFGSGSTGYTLCTTAACNSQPGINVYTRGTSPNPAAFDVDTIFEIVSGAKVQDDAHARPTRKNAKYLLNRVSTVHVGKAEEYIMVEPEETCADRGLMTVDKWSCTFAARQAMKAAGVVGWVPGHDHVTEFGIGYDAQASTYGYNAMSSGCNVFPGPQGADNRGYKSYFNMGIGKATSDYRAICRKQLSVDAAGSSAMTGFSFRNAPNFVPNVGHLDSVTGGVAKNPYGDDDHLAAACYHETDALIDHLFEHDNTPPFIAYRLIQRMVSSNPSPRYVKAVATAFATGKYGDKTYTGEYGDLGAAIAAILLDREARSPLLEADRTHGSLREPILKVTHMMRAMEYRSKYSQEIDMSNLKQNINQRAFSSPSVFNFYLPEFVPDGAIAAAGLVSPESQIAIPPTIVGYLNGISSLINNGLSSCDRGFGTSLGGYAGYRDCNKKTEQSDGFLDYAASEPTNPAQVVDEMALLMTPGRLTPKARQVMIAAYSTYAEKSRLDMKAIGATARLKIDKWWESRATYEYGTAESTIDGKVDIESNADPEQFCFKSGVKSRNGTSIEVDLGQAYNIASVRIHSRADCCGTQTQDIFFDGNMCSEQIQMKTKSQLVAAGCTGLAQVITIHRREDFGQMQLCEIEVIVNEAPDTSGNYPNMMPENFAPALRHLQKLFAIAPEYHATNYHAVLDEERGVTPPQVSAGEEFKGVVVVFLAGGADSFSMLMPHSGCTQPKDPATSDDDGGGGRRMIRGRRSGLSGEREAHDLYAEFQTERGAAFTTAKNDLLPIDVSSADGQPCTKFGLHPKLKALQKLYQQGDAMVVSNAGVLVEPVASKAEYQSGDKNLPPGVFAHNSMQKGVRTVNAENANAKGVLGRMVTKVQEGATAMKAKLYSFSGYSRMLDGAKQSPDIIDPSDGVVRFMEYEDLASDIEAMTHSKSGSVMAESYAASLEQSLASTEYLGGKLENTTLESDCENEGADPSTCITFPSSLLGKQLKEAAKVIHLDSGNFKTDRAAYYTMQGGFDTHGTMDIDEHMATLDGAIDAFHKEMVHQGVWDQVAILICSDFGRTITTNSQGTDHAWGGNYFLIGGKVDGGKMLGKYPTRLKEGANPLNLGRGRIIPTTPWESVWHAIAQWWGISSKDELESLLPHAKNFPGGVMFQQSDVFQR